MPQKIITFIASSSERSRKIIAGIVVGLAGIMLFFAWTAGVSARLPLLGSEFDGSSAALSSQTVQPQANEGAPATPAVSPMKGLIDSFQDLVRLFRGEYPAVSSPSPTASSSSARPIDELFNKIADETPSATSTQTVPSGQVDNQPPAEELPGL